MAIIDPAVEEPDVTASCTLVKPEALSPPETLIVAPGQFSIYVAAASWTIGMKTGEPKNWSEPVAHIGALDVGGGL